MGHDEEMDTTPLTQNQPFFMIDKEKGRGTGEGRLDDGDDSDSGQDEDPNCSVEGDEEDDREVSITKKTSTNGGRVGNGESTKAYGNQHSESEESSEDEDVEDDEKDQIKRVKCLPVSSTPQCQTLAS